MSSSPQITTYFKPTKKRRLSEKTSSQPHPPPPTKIQATAGNAVTTDKVTTVPFRHSGPLSPVKKKKTTPDPTPLEIKKLLAKAEKLEDLKHALTKFGELEKRRKKTTPTEQPQQRADAVEKKRQPHPQKDDDIFTSPVKLKDIKSQTAPPAFKRFHHLISTTPTVDKPRPQRKEPKEPAPPPLPLPHPHSTLLALFTAVETVLALLSQRGSTSTPFSKLKSSVGQIIHTISLKETHIGQFLTVLPGCYVVHREGEELIVATKEARGGAIEGRKAEFREELRKLVEREHQTYLLSLTPPIIIPPELKLTRYHPGFQCKAPIQPHPLPEVKKVTIATARDLLGRAGVILTNRRVKNVVEGVAKEEGGSIEKVGVVEKKEKPTLSQLKGVSKELIEKIRARSTAKTLTALTTPPAHSLAKLHPLVPLLRNIFMTERKAALELDLVLQRLLNSLNNGTERATLSTQLCILSSHAPTFLTILTLSSGSYCKVNLDVQTTDVLSRLKC